jgi:hypothetical protein
MRLIGGCDVIIPNCGLNAMRTMSSFTAGAMGRRKRCSKPSLSGWCQLSAGMGSTNTSASTSWAIPFGPGGPGSLGEELHRLPSCDQQPGRQGDPYHHPPLADSDFQNPPAAGGYRAAGQPVGARPAELLWAVLPVPMCSALEALFRPDPDCMGATEV